MRAVRHLLLLVWGWASAAAAGGPAVEEYVRDLRSETPSVRENAAASLGRLADRSAAPALAEALKDREAGVRREAAKALGFIKDARAAAPLREALGDSDRNVRFYAAYALGEIRDPTARDALLKVLRDPAWEVRDQAAWALRELRDPSLAEALAAALKEANADAGHIQWVLRQISGKGPPGQQPSLPDAPETAGRQGRLAAHWSFDELEGRVAKDSAGRGVHGQILGCEPAEGKVGRALRFGKGKYVELGKPDALPVAERPFTVMAWAKPDARNGVVVARGGAFCGYSLYVKDGLPKFGIHCVEGGPAYIAAGRHEAVSVWVHLAGVVKADGIELYVNGKLAATTKTPGYLPSNCGQGMEIGFDVGNSPAEITDPFEGVIDEVKVFDAALSAEEIAEQAK